MDATAIAQHLNVIEEAILEIRVWARVLWVRVKGVGCRFVSKKVVKMEKIKLSVIEAAEKLAATINASGKKAKVWDRKGVRIYTQYGYLEIAPETAEAAQVRYFTKSYEIKELKPFVTAFNESNTVVEKDVEIQVLMQEDEDGVIAPEGMHEPGVYIVREWFETVKR